MRTCLILMACLGLASGFVLKGGPARAEEHWNQFRGPRGDGQAADSALPVAWDETKNVAWKTAIHGKAWSSPVVWGNQVWMTSATEDGKQLFAVCVDALTGKIVHDIQVFAIEEPMFCYPYNSYGSPTPVVEEGRLWVHFGSAGTACLDTATGKTLWARQDLPCNHHRGPGSSPIVFQNLLIVNFDGFDQQYVVALDKRTGETVWRTDRTIDYGTQNGDAKKAYSTPLVIDHDGKRQLISPAAVATVAYEPETGKELWSVYHGGFNAAARPLFSHGMVFLNLEGGTRLLAVRPDGSGNVTDSHIVWTCKKATPTRPSQLIVGDYFYMINDAGIISCLDARTGEIRWTERMGGRHSASPIHADGKIYCFDEDGVSRVVAANPDKFELLAENRLEAGCMASPAVSGNALFLRTKTHLYRIEQPADAVSAKPSPTRPNILFLFADDMAYDTIAAHGNTEIETPNLDRLARQGVSFTRAYNQGGYHGAVCVASRTMLVTGRFLWNAKNEEPRLKSQYQEKNLLWPQLLEQAGYDTYFSGKWHIRADADQAFTVARHVRPGMPKQTPQGYNRPREGQPDDWQPWDTSRGGFWEGGKHWSEVLADDAVEYLDRAATRDRPFFMYLAFNAPHDPRQSPQEYVDKYPLDRIRLPEPFLPEYPLDIGSNRIRDEQLAPFPRTEYSVKVNRREYYALISHLDAQIGRILDALEKTGKGENTYIVFTADHGLACGHHGLMGKQNMFDHSVRVPFIIAGPSLPPDSRRSARIYLQDVMPTSLELAGVPCPKHVQFKSLLPLLTDAQQQSYPAIYGAYTDTQRMVTEGDYKLIVYPKIQRQLLFDLDQDPLETRDLADDPAYAERLAELQARLRDLQPMTGDPLTLD